MPIDRTIDPGLFRSRREEQIQRHAAKREPFVRAAMLAAMRDRVRLREGLQRNTGVWWPEMAPLSPAERTGLLVELRKMWDLAPDRRMAPLEGAARATGPTLTHPD